jgi:hypothetical protein
MNDLLTKADLRVFEEEIVLAIRRDFRRALWLGTAGTTAVNGILLAVFLALT